MKIEVVQKFPPIINVYTNCCVPKRFSGFNVGFINFIRPNVINDKGLINHEITHAKQFWKNPIKYCLGRWLKYFKFLPEEWRFWSNKMTTLYEAEGYAVQICTYLKEGLISKKDVEQLVDTFTEYIYTKYNIYGISYAYIKQVLNSFVEDKCLS